MNIDGFKRLLEKNRAAVTEYYRRRLPVKAGAKVKSIVQENFRLGGFQDGGLQAWPATRRQMSGGRGADARRKPLLSGRKALYNATGYTPGNASVTIFNNAIYAAIHNYGGTLHPRVTPRMRKYAWARYYREAGGKNNGKATDDASFWKGLALTKKQNLTVTIPKRQFIGPSRTVDRAVGNMIKDDLNTILKQ